MVRRTQVHVASYFFMVAGAAAAAAAALVGLSPVEAAVAVGRRPYFAARNS